MIILLLVFVLLVWLAQAILRRRHLAERASGERWRVVVSFTTSPERLESTRAMLRSVFRQTVYDERVRIVAALPTSFRGVPCHWPERLPPEYDRVECRYVQDVGPATKLVYADPQPGELVVSLDDDHVYGERLLGSLIGHHLFVDRACIWTSESRWIAGDRGRPTLFEYRCHSTDCQGAGLVMGFSGVLYPPGFLLGAQQEFARLADGPCRLCDDITITARARRMNVAVRGAHVWPPWYLDPSVSSHGQPESELGSALQAQDIKEPLQRELANYRPWAGIAIRLRTHLGKLGLINSNSLRYQECLRSLDNRASILYNRPRATLLS